MSRPAVLLAGGIGITPFPSMIRHAAHERLPHKLFLFYANRHPEDAPFLNELNAIGKENVNFTFVPTMTAVGRLQQQWTGETGHIDAEMLNRHLSDLWDPPLQDPSIMWPGRLRWRKVSEQCQRCGHRWR